MKMELKPNFRAAILIAIFALQFNLAGAQTQAQVLPDQDWSQVALVKSFNSLPQQTAKPLKDVLRQLEKEYSVSFAYEESTVNQKKVVLDKKQKPKEVNQVLDALLPPLDLQYRSLDGRQYIIIPASDKTETKQISPKTAEDGAEPSLFQMPAIEEVMRAKLTNLSLVVDRTITGMVTSKEDGSPVPGVNVLAKGTTRGTVTDVNGKYSLSVPDNVNTLVFSYVGFETQEIALGTSNQINVTLVPDLKVLQDVVVIGYGEREKKDLTGAISAVKAEDIAKSIAVQPELAMQGRMTGVFVSTPGGAPNQRPQVRIRGVSTFGYAEPLYVIDGIPVTEFGSGVDGGLVGDIRGNVNVLNLINPNDIESISVLKDASAAAIYGVRAANGVILITTKRGKEGRPKVEVSAQRGVQNVPKMFNMLDVPQYTALYQEAYANNPNEARTLPPEFVANGPSFLGNRPTVDWQTPLLQRNAISEDYSARVAGGTQATSYYVSAGYGRTQSTLVANDMERYSVAANVKSTVNKWLEVGLTGRFGYINSLDNTQTDLGYVSRTSPWQQIYDPNNRTGFAPSASASFIPNPDLTALVERGIFQPPIPPFVFAPGSPQLLWGVETNNNPFATQTLNRNNYSMLRNMGTGYVQIEPLKGLKIKGSISGDWYYNQRKNWSDFNSYLFSQTPGNPYSGNNGLSVGSYGERHTRNSNLISELTVNYNKTIGNHSIDILLNHMNQRYVYNYASVGDPVQVSRDPNIVSIGNGRPGFVDAQQFFNVNALQGYMGRLSYNYKSKYYLDATIRRDGSSRFAPGYKWGTFPAVSAAWRVTEESFMKSLTFINNLKIRGGWGSLGNQETRSFAFLSTVSFSPDYAYGSGLGNAIGSLQQGIRLPDFPVLDLSWERAETSNLGFDALFLDKINVSFDYYNRTTRGILQGANLAASVGNENQPILNIATVRNSGIELELGFTQKVGNDLTLNFSGNLTTVRNRVVSVFGGTPFGGEGGRIQEGYSMFYLWGYQVGGIFQSQEEIQAWRQANSDATNGNNFAPGDMYFQDVRRPNSVTGTPINYEEGTDGVINPLDRTYLGKTIPGYYYGFNIAANWKGLDLSIFFQGVGDVQKINGERWGGEGMGGTGSNLWATTLNRWTPSNPSTTMPRAVRSDPAGNARFSSRWVENAGFMRLKNMQIGYTLPRKALDFMGKMDNLRVFLSGTNLLTFTQWTGIDPENDILPPARTIMLGLTATF
jgi:TonB-dependent starch-binding outer membrane protein SusC